MTSTMRVFKRSVFVLGLLDGDARLPGRAWRSRGVSVESKKVLKNEKLQSRLGRRIAVSGKLGEENMKYPDDDMLHQQKYIGTAPQS
jgi:hypothetical protein